MRAGQTGSGSWANSRGAGGQLFFSKTPCPAPKGCLSIPDRTSNAPSALSGASGGAPPATESAFSTKRGAPLTAKSSPRAILVSPPAVKNAPRAKRGAVYAEKSSPRALKNSPPIAKVSPLDAESAPHLAVFSPLYQWERLFPLKNPGLTGLQTIMVGRVTRCAPAVGHPRVRRAEDCPPYQLYALRLSSG